MPAAVVKTEPPEVKMEVVEEGGGEGGERQRTITSTESLPSVKVEVDDDDIQIIEPIPALSRKRKSDPTSGRSIETVEVLRKKLEMAEWRSNRLEKQAESLKTRLAEAEGTVEKMKKEMENGVSIGGCHYSITAQQRSYHSELLTRLTQAQTTISQLEEKYDGERKERKILEVEVNFLRGRMKDFRNNEIEERSAVEGMQPAQLSNPEPSRKMKQNLEEMKQKLDRANREIETLEEQYEFEKTTRRKLESKLKDGEEVEKLKSRMDRLKHDLERADNTIKGLDEQNEIEKNERRRLEYVIVEMDKKEKEKKVMKKDVGTDCAGLEVKNEVSCDVEEELARLREQKNRVEKDLETANDLCSQQETELKAVKELNKLIASTEIGRTTMELADMKEKLKRLLE